MFKKLGLAAVIAMLAAVPLAGNADDIDDFDTCDASAESSVRLGIASQDPENPEPENADRASACVKDADGNTVAYIGGEVESEGHPGPTTEHACGSVYLNGEFLAGEDQRDFNSDPNDGDCQ